MTKPLRLPPKKRKTSTSTSKRKPMTDKPENTPEPPDVDDIPPPSDEDAPDLPEPDPQPEPHESSPVLNTPEARIIAAVQRGHNARDRQLEQDVVTLFVDGRWLNSGHFDMDRYLLDRFAPLGFDADDRIANLCNYLRTQDAVTAARCIRNRESLTRPPIPDDYTPPPALVPGLVQLGALNLIAGHSMNFKTFYACKIAANVARGLPADPSLSGGVADPSAARKVGFLSGWEDSKGIAPELRFKAAGGPVSMWLPLNGPGLDRRHWTEDLDRMLARKELAGGILIVDNLITLGSHLQVDIATDQPGTTGIMASLNKLSAKHNITILLVHHMNRRGDLYGNTSIKSIPRGIVQITRVPSPTERRRVLVGSSKLSDLQQAQNGYVYELVSVPGSNIPVLTMVDEVDPYDQLQARKDERAMMEVEADDKRGPAPVRASKQDRLGRVQELLQQQDRKVGELATLLDVSESTIYNYLSDPAIEQHVDTRTNGDYFWID